MNWSQNSEPAPKINPPSQEPRRPAFDLPQMLERLGGDGNLLQEVIAIFVDQTPKLIETLRSALARADAETVERTAHSMKGELAYLGVKEVTQQARELEELGRNRDLARASQLFASFEAEVSAILTAVRQLAPGKFKAASSGAEQ